MSFLEVKPVEAEREANKWENAVSDRSTEDMSRFIGRLDLETATVAFRSGVEPLCRVPSSPPEPP